MSNSDNPIPLMAAPPEDGRNSRASELRNGNAESTTRERDSRSNPDFLERDIEASEPSRGDGQEQTSHEGADSTGFSDGSSTNGVKDVQAFSPPDTTESSKGESSKSASVRSDTSDATPEASVNGHAQEVDRPVAGRSAGPDPQSASPLNVASTMSPTDSIADTVIDSALRPEVRRGRTHVDRPASSTPSDKKSAERRFAGRCSPERLSGDTSRQDRRELAAALAFVLRSKLLEGRAIYLDGLGVLFGENHEVPRAYALGAQLAIRRESITRLNFERAGELSPFIRERYHSPLEVADFYQDVYRHLPLALQVAWTPTEMRFYLGGLIALLRREIVLDGFSHRLSPFCSFFSLHNRHGDSTLDWFAGADIFVHSEFEQIRKVDQPKLMERARFDSISEFGEVALGSKRHVFPLNISQALNDIGIHASRSFYPEVEVIVLERAPGRLAFLTSGARHIPHRDGSALGSEFVIDCELSNLAAWPFMVLAALIEAMVSHSGPADQCPFSRASGICHIAIPPAAFGTSGAALHTTQHIWSGALVSQGVSHEQLLLEDGTLVKLLWVTPLLEAERALAERRTPEHVAALLTRKGLMLAARLNRASVLFRTEIL